MRIDRRWLGVLVATAVAAIGGASTCPDAPTGTSTLEGSYHLVTLDGGFPPKKYDPHNTGGPLFAMITGATLEVFPGDSMYFTTQYRNVDSTGAVVGDPYSELFIYWPYYQSGDSLFVDTGGPPYWFATTSGRQVELTVRYPVPPSQGYFFLAHVFVMAK
jgi:hypothetical protein